MRRTPAKVLFIQHAGSLSGSAHSLSYTIGALDRHRFECVVALIRPEPALGALYRDAGIETIEWPGIVTFEHTTAHSCDPRQPLCYRHQVELWRNWASSDRRLCELVARVKPDLVHLNSVVLYPAARTLARTLVPFVWHVREHPVHGSFGLRTKVLARALATLPARAIFLSEADRQAWIGDRPAMILPNFVEPERYLDLARRRLETRARLGLEAEAPVLLFMSGANRLKGAFVLLEALALARRHVPRLRAIFLGGANQPSGSAQSRIARAILPWFGSGTAAQQFEQTIARHDLQQTCLLLPYATDVVDHLAACDTLVFPATKAHFARPVMEAAMAERPAIASRLPGMDELMTDGETGVLVVPNNPTALAAAVVALANDGPRARAMGLAARRLAGVRFTAEHAGKRLAALYGQVLGATSPAQR
jgi:glycosyltransferase involved in cell wall biosynthesis